MFFPHPPPLGPVSRPNPAFSPVRPERLQRLRYAPPPRRRVGEPADGRGRTGLAIAGGRNAGAIRRAIRPPGESPVTQS